MKKYNKHFVQKISNFQSKLLSFGKLKFVFGKIKSYSVKSHDKFTHSTKFHSFLIFRKKLTSISRFAIMKHQKFVFSQA